MATRAERAAQRRYMKELIAAQKRKEQEEAEKEEDEEEEEKEREEEAKKPPVTRSQTKTSASPKRSQPESAKKPQSKEPESDDSDETEEEGEAVENGEDQKAKDEQTQLKKKKSDSEVAARMKELREDALGHRRAPQYFGLRVPWSKVEEKALIKGMKRYKSDVLETSRDLKHRMVAHWRAITTDYPKAFPPWREPTHLKDKWRSWLRHLRKQHPGASDEALFDLAVSGEARSAEVEHWKDLWDEVQSRVKSKITKRAKKAKADDHTAEEEEETDDEEDAGGGEEDGEAAAPSAAVPSRSRAPRAAPRRPRPRRARRPAQQEMEEEDDDEDLSDVSPEDSEVVALLKLVQSKRIPPTLAAKLLSIKGLTEKRPRSSRHRSPSFSSSPSCSPEPRRHGAHRGHRHKGSNARRHHHRGRDDRAKQVVVSSEESSALEGLPPVVARTLRLKKRPGRVAREPQQSRRRHASAGRSKSRSRERRLRKEHRRHPEPRAPLQREADITSSDESSAPSPAPKPKRRAPHRHGSRHRSLPRKALVRSHSRHERSPRHVVDSESEEEEEEEEESGSATETHSSPSAAQRPSSRPLKLVAINESKAGSAHKNRHVLRDVYPWDGIDQVIARTLDMFFLGQYKKGVVEVGGRAFSSRAPHEDTVESLGLTSGDKVRVKTVELVQMSD